MKKTVSEFIAKKDLSKIFVKDWQKIVESNSVNVLEHAQSFLDSEKKAKDNPIFLEVVSQFCSKIEDHSYREILLLWSMKTIINKAAGEDGKEPKFFTLSDFIIPVVDSDDKLRGVVLSEPRNKNIIKADSPLDVWGDLQWKTQFKCEYLNAPIYPNAGLRYWGGYPDLEKEIGIYSGQALFLQELSYLYRKHFPGKSLNNTKEYYENLYKFGLTPSISTFYFLMFKSAGLFKDSVTLQQFETLARPAYLEF